MDLVLAASVVVAPSQVQQVWTRNEEHLAQNRILIQDAGVFYDRTFGADGVAGGSGANQDRLPLRASNTCGVATGDIDGDGDVDIVFAEYGPLFLGDVNIVLLNDGQGHFTQAANPFGAVSRASVDVELGDLDNNGKPDLVFANANPFRASVVSGPAGGPWVLSASANKRRNEIWLNFSTASAISLQGLQVPDPPAVPDPNAEMPYNDPGFWNDTRSVTIGDIDNDNDLDILFANNGWDSGEPDQRSNVLTYAAIGPKLTYEHHGQAPQLLLNMGGSAQQGIVPKPGGGTMGLGDFLDTGYYALPWARTNHMTELNPDGSTARSPDGGIRVSSDFELTRQLIPGGPSDLGSPADLTVPYSGGPTGGLPVSPVPDGYPELLVIRGFHSPSTVYVNSGNWGMVQNPSTGQWYTKGRFFRGDMQLNTNWNQVGNELANLWEVQPWDSNGDGINDRGPFTNLYARFGIAKQERLYATDGDWIDLDNDGQLDVATANSEVTHGQINNVFLYRGMQRGLRWSGPSDEGALLPYVNSVLAYGVDTGDVDRDGDIDIVVAGVPTALVLCNQGGAQGGIEGSFKEVTFQDNGNGWLPFTGHHPLYAPLLTETVALFDADNDDSFLEMFFSGYPVYNSLGQQYPGAINEASEWHYYDTSYYNPVTDPMPGAGNPVLPHCTHYVGMDSGNTYEDRTLGIDQNTGQQWLDRNGRTLENIADEARAGDLDNDGDQDIVAAYRIFVKNAHPHITNWTTRLDPELHQVGLSLWINDGQGHLKDEAVARLGPGWQLNGAGADNYFWDAIAGDHYEGLAFADVDSDGDLDMLAISTTESTTNPPRNRLFVNMGGAQKNAGGGNYRTGEFRVAGLPGGPLAQWGGVFGADYANFGGIEVEMADFNNDDAPDFCIAGFHPHSQFTADGVMNGYLLMNNGDGSFDSTDFAQLPSPLGTGVLLDAWFNHQPGGWDSTFAVEPGDFDGDGDWDVVLLPTRGHSPRLLENVTESPLQLAFEDRSSTGSASVQGSATVDGISWITGWASDGKVDDFNGDGLHDVYVANLARTTQDEILYSSAEERTGPWISRVVPKYGQVTGRTLQIKGVNLGGVNTAWFERGPTAVSAAVLSSSSREVLVIVPPSAPLGFGRVYVGREHIPGARSNAFPFTHLNAAPKAVKFIGLSQGILGVYQPGSVMFGFRATDADGVSDIDPVTWRITRVRGATETVWTSTSPGPWSYSVQADQVELAARLNQRTTGDVFSFEIGDNKAAYGFAHISF